MAVTGTPDGGPLRAGYPVADTTGGLTAAFAIAAALNADPRGCVIDTSMLEATMATMAWVISNHLIAGLTRPDMATRTRPRPRRACSAPQTGISTSPPTRMNNGWR
jgi:crotonobetainyl-CoA:carnitine CoA-transferase CaiB-like acyl-CoA transferase